jgi:hypothetical protein
MLRLGSTDGAFAEVRPALQQRSTVGFHCDSLPAPQGDCVAAGQQPCPAVPMEQASTGMATPRRLNQITKIAVSRRIACSALYDPAWWTLDPSVSSVGRSVALKHMADRSPPECLQRLLSARPIAHHSPSALSSL